MIIGLQASKSGKAEGSGCWMIIHIDMDAFYASVEIRDNPALRDKPVIIGGSPQGRGVVSTANYVAREFGVHSAMPAAQAVRLCPHAVFLRPRMEHYVAISQQIREIFFRFTSLVEPLSLDEAFLDVSGCESLFGPAPEIARKIKATLRNEVGLVASAGVAPNKFLAKVASDLEKPDGLVVVPAETIQSFLDPLPIRRVWGIGPQTEKRFNALGVSTVAGIRGLAREQLHREFGANSEHFYRLARGWDSRAVVPEHEAKSVSHENTFPVNVEDPEMLRAWLQELMGQVTVRMRRAQVKGKTVRIKVRFSDFRTITRSETLNELSFETRLIETTAQKLLAKILRESQQPVRLLGAGMANLRVGVPVQQTLFDAEEKQKQSRIDEACDELKQKFGAAAVRTAAALESGVKIHRNPTTEDHKSN